MNKQNLMLGILGVVMFMAIAPQAMAQVCLLRSYSGACLFYSGSTKCENLNGTGAGNVTTDPKYFVCNVTPQPALGDIPGVVFCSNNGNNVAPGVQAFLGGSISGYATIYPSQVDSNGVASGVNASAEATPEQLAQLNQYCQNPNWYAVDFVPSAMDVTVQMIDTDGNIVANGSQTFSCTLPNAETLGWDKKAKRPERRGYDCIEN